LDQCRGYRGWALTEPMGYREFNDHSRFDLFLSFRNLSFGVLARMLLIINVCRNLIGMVKQCRDNGSINVATSQHFVDHPPHGVGTVAFELAVFTETNDAL